MIMGEVWEVETIVRKCDSTQVGVKVVSVDGEV